jgi:hypothetical protein
LGFEFGFLLVGGAFLVGGAVVGLLVGALVGVDEGLAVRSSCKIVDTHALNPLYFKGTF